MDSVYAYRLSKAIISYKPCGDFIDNGWAVLKALNEAGFDITPQEPINSHPAKTLNEMCGYRKAKEKLDEEDAPNNRDRVDTGAVSSGSNS